MKQTIAELLSAAEKAQLPPCKECPRGASVLGKDRLFASSCKKHFSRTPCKAMFVYRDPSRSEKGCAGDNLVCAYCHKDATAVNHRKLMEQYKIDAKQIYNTNAVLCGTISKNKAPTSETVSKCSIILADQIKLIKPTIIVTFGLHALKGVKQALGREIPKPLRLSDVAGHQEVYDGIRIFPTYHLSPLNFNTNKKSEEIEKHWKWLASILPNQTN